MANRKGKVQIEIEREYDGCRWIWAVWIDGKYRKSEVEDTVKDAMDAVLEWLESEGGND